MIKAFALTGRIAKILLNPRVLPWARSFWTFSPEGKHKTKTETAQRLLAMGLSAEQVAKATQLSLEIIKNLSNS